MKREYILNKIAIVKLLIITVVFVFILTSCATRVSSIKLDQDIKLEQDEGYLLIEVDTKRSLYKILLTGQKKIYLTKDDLKAGSNYIFINLPAGDYQIERIYTNYYSRFSFKNEYWNFSVKPRMISYVGSLQVKANYWGGVASFELINNSSLALEYLEEKFPNVLENRLVEYSGPGEDRFFSHVRSTPSTVQGVKQ
ncbi:hypothetical protein [Aliikangiella sp. IMCC44359]|uniref:hypothetical protein n=1 Tax=Aliikangiella sp. IMCC44359 TaxID=3459125 RepID=UPI00403ADD03